MTFTRSRRTPNGYLNTTRCARGTCILAGHAEYRILYAICPVIKLIERSLQTLAQPSFRCWCDARSSRRRQAKARRKERGSQKESTVIASRVLLNQRNGNSCFIYYTAIWRIARTSEWKIQKAMVPMNKWLGPIRNGARMWRRETCLFGVSEPRAR